MKRLIVGKNAPPVGRSPAVVLWDPKFAHNVAGAMRLISCYGHGQLWFTGDRVRLDIEARGRIPREERMRGYKDVDLYSYERPLEQFPRGVVPVAVELCHGAERLHQFEHPEHAVYVFGPEDGSLPPTVLAQCHRFLVIPTRHCLNLATAVATVLWDRAYKRGEIPTDIDNQPSIPERELAAEMGLFDYKS